MNLLQYGQRVIVHSTNSDLDGAVAIVIGRVTQYNMTGDIYIIQLPPGAEVGGYGAVTMTNACLRPA